MKNLSAGASREESRADPPPPACHRAIQLVALGRVKTSLADRTDRTLSLTAVRRDSERESFPRGLPLIDQAEQDLDFAIGHGAQQQ